MAVELLFSGYYRGPETFLDSYTFLKLYPDGRWVFAEGYDAAYDFPGRLGALRVERLSLEQAWGGLDDGYTRIRWGRYRRGQEIPALNCNNQVVGRLADALEETCEAASRWGRFQVKVVGPGQLQPTTHDVVLTFVSDVQTERPAAPRPADG